MSKPLYGFILFHTSQAAIKAERILGKAGFKVKLIPVPRHLSSDCGVCLQFDWEDEKAVRPLIESANVEIEGIHKGAD